MLPGLEMMGCQNLAVPAEVMQHVVNVESSRNPYAIGVVGGQLVRQPQNLGEAVATVKMLEDKGFNYSLGVAQVNRANLSKFGLDTYEKAFDYCPNLQAGSKILAQCYGSAGNDWGKAFSCYYSGNFTTGYQDGYVQKIYDSMARSAEMSGAQAIPLMTRTPVKVVSVDKGATALQPDGSAYRVAMRSVLDGAASAAIGPAVAALSGAPSPIPQMGQANAAPSRMSPLDGGLPAQAEASPGRIPVDAATAAAMSQVGVNVRNAPAPDMAGRIRTDPATAAVMSQIGVSPASPAGNVAAPTAPASDDDGGVFVPQVHGLNEAVPASPAATQAPASPAHDGADLRTGAHDDAFVF